MAQIYLDVTRLLHRTRQGLLPTGVDRVGLAYVQHYRQHARAVLSYRGWFGILPQRQSSQLFDRLVEGRAWSFAELGHLVASAVRECLSGRFSSGILLHTAHSGIEFERYYRDLSGHGVGLVAIIHDLIPLTHPEYCRPGVLVKQAERMTVALSKARGIIANSVDTARSIEVFAPGWERHYLR